MTSTFKDTTLDGAGHAFMWSDIPFVSKKIESRRRRPADRDR